MTWTCELTRRCQLMARRLDAQLESQVEQLVDLIMEQHKSHGQASFF